MKPAVRSCRDRRGVSLRWCALAWLLFLWLPAAALGQGVVKVGDRVWHDLDRDGIQDADEPGMPGITVQLWNGARTQLLSSTLSGADGLYLLEAPGPGQYRVRVLLPPDAVFSPRKAGSDMLKDSDIHPSGEHFGYTDVLSFASNVISITSIDAGIAWPHPVSVGDRVWHDLDGDGVQDANEPGLAGVHVRLWDAGLTHQFDATITNGAGNYTLVGPGPGEYRVQVLLPPGARFSPKDQGGNNLLDSDITPAGAMAGFTDVLDFPANVIGNATVDAGVILPEPFGGRVWNDLDGDGVREAGEPGLGGITVQLWDAAVTQVLDSTTTGPDGRYTLLAPLPGDYRIRVVLPGAGIAFSPMQQGGNAALDSDIFPSGLLAGLSDTLVANGSMAFDSAVDAGLVGYTVFRNGFE